VSAEGARPDTAAASTAATAATAAWLERAASWRVASLLFQWPSAELVAELQSVAREVRPEWRDEAVRLAAHPIDDWQTEYHRVLGPGGCPASESSYDDNALAGRGPLLARVAGFYEAFAYRPDTMTAEVPDHIANELGFLSYLSLKCAFADYSADAGSLEVAAEAYVRFQDEHLAWWIDRLCERLDGTESPRYTAAVAWARRVAQSGRA